MIFSLFFCIICLGELMKKCLLLIMIFIILIGCKKKEKVDKEDTNVLSYGELTCAYKEQNISDNTIYTSLYIFNFDNNGILNGATNKETIEFSNSSKELKKTYKENLEEIMKEYEDIDGLEVKKYIEENKYSFEVIMDNNKMEDEIKKDYLLDQDRINLYQIFTEKKYTCE